MTALEAVLIVFLVFSLLIVVLLSVFCVLLYKAAERKQLQIFEYHDLILTVSKYLTESTGFLNGELARNIGNSEAPNFLELKMGLSDLRDKIRLFAGVANDIKESSSKGG